MTFIDEQKHPMAPEIVLKNWVEDTKEKQQKFKDWLLDDPSRGITKEFAKEMEQERMNQFRGDGGSDVRNLSFKIPAAVYMADPDFWKEELQNKKRFREKYPYFVV